MAIPYTTLNSFQSAVEALQELIHLLHPATYNNFMNDIRNNIVQNLDQRVFLLPQGVPDAAAVFQKTKETFQNLFNARFTDETARNLLETDLRLLTLAPADVGAGADEGRAARTARQAGQAASRAMGGGSAADAERDGRLDEEEQLELAMALSLAGDNVTAADGGGGGVPRVPRRQGKGPADQDAAGADAARGRASAEPKITFFQNQYGGSDPKPAMCSVAAAFFCLRNPNEAALNKLMTDAKKRYDQYMREETVANANEALSGDILYALLFESKCNFLYNILPSDFPLDTRATHEWDSVKEMIAFLKRQQKPISCVLVANGVTVGLIVEKDQIKLFDSHGFNQGLLAGEEDNPAYVITIPITQSDKLIDHLEARFSTKALGFQSMAFIFTTTPK